jgi:four helix bundle protein
MQFAHEKLSVYQKALEFFDHVQDRITSWSKQHAFVDHLMRASESILFNLAEAVRLAQPKKKALSLDYAIGSVFECAACLDIAAVKGLLQAPTVSEHKRALLELCKMMVGLRKSWTPGHVAEASTEYIAGNETETDGVFYHEKLDRYSVAIDFYRWLVSTTPGRSLNDPFGRSVDTLATRIVLNIAEGSGRYAELSRQDFLDTANAAAAKLAVALDMGARRGIWTASEAGTGKSLLVRVAQMTARKTYIDSLCSKDPTS